MKRSQKSKIKNQNCSLLTTHCSLLLFGALLLALGNFSPAGAAVGRLWAKHYQSMSAYAELDHVVSVASDAQGNVYVAGTSKDTLSDTVCYITTKYNQWDRKVWQTYFKYRQYNTYALDTEPPSPCLALDDAHSRLYLVATEKFDDDTIHRIRAVKYNTLDGSIIWSDTMRLGNVNEPTDDYVSGMVFDSVNGALYVCATSFNYVPGVDTAAYYWGVARLDTASGFPVSPGWHTLYQQSPEGNARADDYATGIALSPITRDPVVCGTCYSDFNGFRNWVTADFSCTDGSLQWAAPWRRDSISGDEYPYSVAADTSGIYVAGGVYIDSLSQYDWGLLKVNLTGGLVDSAICNVSPDVFEDNWLNSVKSTAGGGGRVCAAGLVNDDNTNSLDWLVLDYSTGDRQTGRLTYLWRAVVDDDHSNSDIATEVLLDSLNRPWVLGSIDPGPEPSDTTEWMVRRFNPASGSVILPDLVYYRNALGGTDGVPTNLAMRDTSHIYIGGFTEPTDTSENQTVVRFGTWTPSAALDSFRDSTFAWRDTVDSGSTVRVRAFYHNNGYSLATPKIKASLNSFYSDSGTDTIGALPESARAVLMDSNWTAQQRGSWVMRCTLDLAGDTSAGNNLQTRSVFVRVTDVGPDSLGFADTVDEGVAFTLAARVNNYGNVDVIATFPIAFQVGDSIKETTVAALPAGAVTQVTSPAFRMPMGTYQARTYTQLPSDLCRSNDTLNGPESLLVRRYDIACTGILVPSDSCSDSTLITPSAVFKNLGNVATTFRADFVITSPGACALPPSTFHPSQFTIPSPSSSRATMNDERGTTNHEAGTPSGSPSAQPPAGPLTSLLSRALASVGTHKSAVLSSHSGVPSPQSAVGSSQSAIVSPQSAPRTPQFALGTPYRDSILSITLPPAESAVESFSSWFAAPIGNYQATCYSTCALDPLHGNDTAHESFTVAEHNVGVVAILAPLDTMKPGDVTPRATVHNYGSVTETFEVYFRIMGLTAWRDSLGLTLASGRDSTISFGSWVVSPGDYRGTCWTTLALDENRSNDTMSAEFVVVMRDVGTVAILAPLGDVDSGLSVTPQAVVRNRLGNTVSFFVRFEIGSLYVDSQPANLGPGATDTLSFLDWIAGPLGLQVTSCSTMLAYDDDSANDRLTDSVRVLRGEGVDEERLALPPVFTLYAPRPNPFSAQTIIRYGLPRTAHVAVGIYAATGQLLKSLYCGTQRAGYYSLPPDLGSLPEGVYYCRLVSDEFRAVRKLVKVH